MYNHLANRSFSPGPGLSHRLRGPTAKLALLTATRQLNKLLLCVVLAASFTLLANLTHAATLRVAVASNFKPALEQLLPAFQQTEPDAHIDLISAASGILYAQILHGAPFDVFLSADAQFATELARLKLAGAAQTYTIGRILLLSRTPITCWRQTLREAQRIAIANPALAPYGVAAQQILQRAEVALDGASPQIVKAGNIAQVQHWFSTGHINVALAAAALQTESAAHQLELTELAEPIRQMLVQLNRSKAPQLSQRFIHFLLSAEVQTQLQQLGYLAVTNDKTATEASRLNPC